MSETETDLDERLLGALVPMTGLRPELLRELVPHAELVRLAPGEEHRPDADAADETVYVVAGTLEVEPDDGPPYAVTAGTEAGRHPVAGLDAAVARARDAVTLLVVKRAVVSNFLIWENYSPARQGEPAPGEEQWTPKVLRSELLSKIPPANVERIFNLLEPVPVAAGEVIVRQGDPGDYYYVIERGRCEVTHRSSPDAEPVLVAELEAGESFGEEALLSETERNASVSMLSEGVILRMTKEDFVELIRDPVLSFVDRRRAEAMVSSGGVWLDVRLREEFLRDAIPGSLHVPLSRVRSDVEDLDRGLTYVVYCNSGRRSAAAAFLMSERGFAAHVLAGGLLGAGVPETPAPAAGTDLHAELARVNVELEVALLQKAEVDAERRIASDDALRETEEARARVDERREQLEADSTRASEALTLAMARKRDLEQKIRASEADAAGQRKQAEVTVERLRRQAEARLREERDRLRREYAQAAQRMELLRRARDEAEAEFRAQRERLAAELDEKRRAMQSEARRIRADLEAQKRAAEAKVDRIRSVQRSEEQRLREETESRLRSERRRLETEFAMSVAAQEKAKQDLELAQAARLAAQHEAERLATELRAAVQRRRARETARADAERARLEQESAAASDAVAAAERARAAAEERRRDLASTIVRFSDTGIARSREEALRAELETFESELEAATEQLGAARRAKEAADRRQRTAEARIVHQRAAEEELRLQLAQEMEVWLEDERVRSEHDLEEARRQAEALDRIQREKDAARQRARESAENMMSDIAAQLAGGPDPDDEDWNANTIRLRTSAEQRATLAREAIDGVGEEKRKAEEALKRAREQLERLRAEHR